MKALRGRGTRLPERRREGDLNVDDVADSDVASDTGKDGRPRDSSKVGDGVAENA
jgi:hypothetical protein